MDGDAVLVDTNVLLTATTPARELHRHALTVLNGWSGRGVSLCLSGQVLREYLVVATRPVEVNGLGLSVVAALDNVAQFRKRLRFLDERAAAFERLRRLMREVDCQGKQIHDANLVATALVHGVGRILTANVDDFQRFAGFLSVVDLADADSS